MGLAVNDLVSRVRHRIASGAHSDDLAELVQAEAGGIVDDVVLGDMRRDIAAELVGAGPLEPLLALPGVTDVLVNAADDVWLDRGRGLERAAQRFADETAVRRLAQRLAAAAGRRLDDACPYVDATLPDGSRLHAVLPPLAEHTTISLRVLARERRTLDDLIRSSTVPAAIAELLRAAVAARLAFVITGGSGAGKTTLLGALLSCVSATERLLLIEDAPEVVVGSRHIVRLVTRPPNVEGAGGVGLRELVRQALRMRPDRIVVGEFRGAEMVDLLVALNTGHDGGAATLHANSAADVPARLVALGMLGGVPPDALTALVESSLQLVVHMRRARDGSRRICEIGVLQRDADRLRVAPAWDAARGWHLGGAVLRDLLSARGVTSTGLLP
jgi:pilus assembly protein CpaF